MASNSSVDRLDSVESEIDLPAEIDPSKTKLVIENHSDDITISKCEDNQGGQEMSSSSTKNAVPALKAQVLPLVYFQNNNKASFMSNKSNNNNFILGPITTSYTNKPNSSKNVILTSGRGPVVLPKPMAIVPAGGKGGSAYVTMLKQVPKPADFAVDATKITEVKMIGQTNGFIQGGTSSQKILLAPMPKVQSNRPPVTATTNSVQSKFTVLPMPVPPNDSGSSGIPKIYNFQISDGKLQYSNFRNPISILQSKNEVPEKPAVSADKLDVIVEKNDISNKTYELSIAEESSSNQSDSRLVVSSVDSNSSSDNNANSKQTATFTPGVSILKKNFPSALFELDKPEFITSQNNSNQTITSTNSQIEEKTAVTSVPKTSKPEKNRRKSAFSFRKDFDDMEISFFDSKTEKTSKLPEVVEVKVEKEVKNEEQPKPEVVPDPKNIFNFSESDINAAKLLKWEDGIGTLPGSDLKFIVNEFGMIEYLLEEDHQKMIEKKQQEAKIKEDMEKEVRCLECGCYGIRSDFISSNFCSNECQIACLNIIKKPPDASSSSVLKNNNKPQKRKFGKNKSDNDIKDADSGDEENSNHSNQDKFVYPWACKKKGFSWSKYLTHVSAKAAPTKLFKDPFPYNRNGFKIGMKLEGVDPQHPGYFCVLSVMDTVGYRIRLHFDGYSDNYDFWVNADSMDIFPMGWCEKYGHVLRPPPGYTDETFNWLQYLKDTKSTAAPKHLFANRAGQAICPNGFRIGMKLEAVDKKDSALVCVATVRDMMDNRLLIHFDGWDDIYDYWADPTSPYIHPVGWCDQYGHNLTPPSDYPTPENFTWEKYLKEKKAVAAPVRAFKQRSACGFKRGMRLECVDKRVPHLIRVATVDDVKEHQIRIHFDGWLDRYSYWVDDDSPDIHPVGWCQKTGHPMEPPLTPDDVYDFLECPTVGCRGQGHKLGLKHSTHSSQKYCPYAEANVDTDKIIPDRLLTPDRSPEAKVPVSREPKDYKQKPRVGRPPKWLKELEASNSQSAPSEEPPEKKLKKKHPSVSPKLKHEKSEEDASKCSSTSTQYQSIAKAKKIIEKSRIYPAEKESWKRHSDFLNNYVSPHDNPLEWSTDDVVDFVSSIPGCESSVANFLANEVDGEALLHLSQRDIVQLLHFKVGPAVKLYNGIVLLRKRFWRTILHMT
ncbi:lethal(3)malignant brain tumor-like protein 4 [Sitophilus oryzae]|uniref:Lethal(3)malignant brain tumor-like protein 4 n=1 Tax=Sitophilus oryzae TaxID=7048 RepID=A0A6J2XUY4_SITOR|nr:lethal(3)malignant brain tumor-like protein 4 [Sitophilus oryzae]